MLSETWGALQRLSSLQGCYGAVKQHIIVILDVPVNLKYEIFSFFIDRDIGEDHNGNTL